MLRSSEHSTLGPVLLRRDLIRRLFHLLLVLMVSVGIASLLLDVLAGTEILLTLLTALRSHP
jgi:hypothetical protein